MISTGKRWPLVRRRGGPHPAHPSRSPTLTNVTVPCWVTPQMTLRYATLASGRPTSQPLPRNPMWRRLRATVVLRGAARAAELCLLHGRFVQLDGVYRLEPRDHSHAGGGDQRRNRESVEVPLDRKPGACDPAADRRTEYATEPA